MNATRNRFCVVFLACCLLVTQWIVPAFAQDANPKSTTEWVLSFDQAGVQKELTYSDAQPITKKSLGLVLRKNNLIQEIDYQYIVVYENGRLILDDVLGAGTYSITYVKEKDNVTT